MESMGHGTVEATSGEAAMAFGSPVGAAPIGRTALAALLVEACDEAGVDEISVKTTFPGDGETVVRRWANLWPKGPRIDHATMRALSSAFGVGNGYKTTHVSGAEIGRPDVVDAHVQWVGPLGTMLVEVRRVVTEQ